MKLSSLIIAALVLIAATPVYSQSRSSKSTAKMRDVATNDQLSQKLRMAQQKDPIRNLGPAVGKKDEDPSVKNTKRDLIASSTILSYNGLLTLVPKRAVLFVPERLESRFGEKPNIQVKTFQDFYAMNRGWIRTIEVTREQALGHTPFNEQTLKAIDESSSVVIATYRGGPISVLPLKDPEEVPLRSEMKPVTYR